MGILAQARSTRDLEHAYFNMLVYGAPGTGKTYMARTAVESGHNVLLLDADHGTMTLRDQDVSSLPITRFDDLMEIYKELQEGDHDYDTVFIDNLSEIQKMLIDQLKHEHGRKFGLHSWAKIVERTSMVCRVYRSLSMNVVMLAHSMEIEDENRVRVRPALSGKKLPHEIGGLFDLVAYSHTAMDSHGNVAYRLGFATVGDRHITKDRSARLDAVETNDFGQLYRKVFPLASRQMQGRILTRSSRPLATTSHLPGAARHQTHEAGFKLMAHPGGAPQAHHGAPFAAPHGVHPHPNGAPHPNLHPNTAPQANTHLAAPYSSGQPAAHHHPTTQHAPTPTAPPVAHAAPPTYPTHPAAPTTSAPPARAALHNARVDGAYGTEAWRNAILQFQQVLGAIAGGDRSRSDAICDYVKRTQNVSSSTEMTASTLRAWSERLEFMASSGVLDESIRDL